MNTKKKSERPFRSGIEDSNQTIKCCGVVSNNQNYIVEIKIKTITLGSRTLILHEKILATGNNYNVMDL